MKKVYEMDFLGRSLVVETGELAKQANGAVGWVIGITKETQRDREAEEVMEVEIDDR